MKIRLKFILLTILITSLGMLSCRNEDSEKKEAPPGEVLEANSAAAKLMKRTALNDGSSDNIIDSANCFSLKLPVTLNVNGLEIIVDSEEDLEKIEEIFEQLDDDEDLLDILFPITIIKSDFSEIVVNDIDQLNDLADECNGENEEDDDIECIDFQYPITASFFSLTNELIKVLNIADDEELIDFLDELDENSIVNITFPITVINSDGVSMEINDLPELVSAIEDAEDDCDEDDDYDFDDDDCDDCSAEALTTLINKCDWWSVGALERNDDDLEDQYEDFYFSFKEDGTLAVIDAQNDVNISGTWTSSGTGNDIIVEITIADLADFNGQWRLQEIDADEDDEATISFVMGDDDELEFESDCDTSNSADLEPVLLEGEWEVGLYTFDFTNKTADFDGYAIEFMEDGTVAAELNDNVINGTWSITGLGTDAELVLEFEGAPFDALNDTWDAAPFDEDSDKLGFRIVGDENTPFEFLIISRLD